MNSKKLIIVLAICLALVLTGLGVTKLVINNNANSNEDSSVDSIEVVINEDEDKKEPETNNDEGNKEEDKDTSNNTNDESTNIEIVENYKKVARSSELPTISLSRLAYDKNVSFNVGNLFPGDSLVKEYEIDVGHDDKITVSFSIIPQKETILNDILNINVYVNDESIYNGPLSSMPKTCDVDVKEGVDTLVYKLDINLPTSASNEYQNKESILDLHWEIMDYVTPDTGVKGFIKKANEIINDYGMVILTTVIIGGILVIYRRKTHGQD